MLELRTKFGNFGNFGNFGHISVGLRKQYSVRTQCCNLIGSEPLYIPCIVNILMCLWKCSQNVFTLDVSTIIKKFPPNVDLQIIERYLNSQHKCSRISFDISEADPGHHRERQPQMWGCQPIILSFSRKLHENEWSWAGRGARPKFVYVDLSSIYSFSVHTCTLYQGPSNRGSLIILTQVTNNLVCRVQRLK